MLRTFIVILQNLSIIIQNGSSKPDEIFGGSSPWSDFFTISICVVVLLIFAFFGIMNLFSRDESVQENLEKNESVIEKIDREENLIKRAKKVMLKELHIINYSDRDEVIEIILSSIANHRYHNYDESKLKRKMNLLSDDDIKRIYFLVTDS